MLDRIDCVILEALQLDGRISNKELAQKSGISPSTCIERVRRLQASGLIEAFHAQLAPNKLGIGVQAMISVRLRRHAEVSFATLREEFMALPEAVVVYLMAGSVDLMVHVAVRDVAHLHKLVSETFTFHSNVASIETMLIFECARSPTLPNYRREEDA